MPTLRTTELRQFIHLSWPHTPQSHKTDWPISFSLLQLIKGYKCQDFLQKSLISGTRISTNQKEGRVSHHGPAIPRGTSTLRNSAHSTCVPLPPRLSHQSQRAARGTRDPPPAIGPEWGGAWPLWRQSTQASLHCSLRWEHLWATGGGSVRVGSSAWAPRTRQKQCGIAETAAGRCAGASSRDPGGWGGALETTPPSGFPHRVDRLEPLKGPPGKIPSQNAGHIQNAWK